MASEDEKIDQELSKEELSTVNYADRPAGGLRRKVYITIFEAETKWGRRFDLILLYAISLSILEVILESDTRISAEYRDVLYYSEWALTIFFTIEYFLRLWCSRRPLKYAKSFFGIVDLLSILPTYIGLFMPGTHYLMTVRVLRLLRIFRILKLVRFVKAAQVLISALAASRHKIYIFIGAVLSIVLIMGTVMYIVEGEENGFTSIARSMYWAIVTMTTVGYGDLVPATSVGKFLASIMMLTGYAIIAVPTGIVSSELSQAVKEEKADACCTRCKSDIYKRANYCHNCGLDISHHN